ncbi:hypothetical protein SVAN01_03484, partial [Stagonosporopsis vannaccii]
MLQTQATCYRHTVLHRRSAVHAATALSAAKHWLTRHDGRQGCMTRRRLVAKGAVEGVQQAARARCRALGQDDAVVEHFSLTSQRQRHAASCLLPALPLRLHSRSLRCIAGCCFCCFAALVHPPSTALAALEPPRHGSPAAMMLARAATRKLRRDAFRTPTQLSDPLALPRPCAAPLRHTCSTSMGALRAAAPDSRRPR